MLTRREWLKLTASGALGAALPRTLLAAMEAKKVDYDYEKPLFDLPGQVKEPVVIESIELLQRGSNYFVQTRAKNGFVGLTPTKQIEYFIPTFEHMVAPHFIGRDMRELESIIDEVYLAHYKDVGLSFWVCLAYCEQSALDLLGKVAGQPVGALLGGVNRKEIPLYLSGSARELKAETEVDLYVRGVAETGAKAVKFKIGGRMSRNLDIYPGRTETVLKLGRERLGADCILYADANGSYDVGRSIEVGRMLEELKYSFFEEPCPYEEFTATQAVTRTLKIPVALGEQNSSLWQFQWMISHGVMDIVQPDINYNGGLIRAIRVARMAAAAGLTMVPHNTQTGVASGNILHFASCVPNIGPFMEYPWRDTQKPADWYAPNFIIKDGRLPVPTGPGYGLTIDPSWLASAKVVAKITEPRKPGGGND